MADPVRFGADEWSAVYDDPRPSATQLRFRHLAEVARREVLARAKAGASWLDVGCGTGHLAAQLAEAGLDVTAVDGEAAMVAAARARFGAGERLRFVAVDAESLDLPAATFDGVVATSLVGCLGDAARFFDEVARVLRPGGHAVVTFTNRASLLNALERRLRSRPSPLAVSARGYSARGARRALAAAGLPVVRMRFVNWFVSAGSRVFPPSRVAFRLDGPVGALFAWNLVALAAKADAPTDILTP